MSKKSRDLVANRQAFHQFEILETFEAGIALLGTEIKSLRDNGGSLSEAFVRVISNELWLIGASIAPYKYGNVNNHEEKRQRKLLMHKKEIAYLKEATKEKGLTIVPLGMYLKYGRVKIKIATARGKKAYDKRHVLKERDDKRRMERAMKHYQK